MKVFIADDSDIVVNRLTAMLNEYPEIKTQGHARDAGQAYRQISSLNPDIVIADLHMPGNGFSLIEKLQEGDTQPIVIVLTNYPYPQYRQQCFNVGADFFFDKSTEFTNVIQVIRELADG